MARKTKAEALATRADILDAAIQVFMDKGVAGATLEQIAEAAGVTRGAIYWHFKNKLEIFRELNNEVQSSFVQTLLEDLDREHEEPLEQLRELCIELLVDLERNPRKRSILLILFLRCDYSGEMAAELQQQQENQRKNVRVFANYFKRAIDKGHLAREVDPNVLSMSLMCYLSGIVFESFRCPGALNLKSNAGKLVDQFFSGLGSCRR
ncbi:TetR family transcriptional regulator [Proteobacteria bacterium 005FR1]|nr:TetR family transcriptional regulator [Proteobacteria bacterium 005FR1]